MTENRLHELANCAEREMRLRRRVYPRWVSENRMTEAKANAEIAMMEEIAVHLRRAARAADPQKSFNLER